MQEMSSNVTGVNANSKHAPSSLLTVGDAFEFLKPLGSGAAGTVWSVTRKRRQSLPPSLLIDNDKQNCKEEGARERTGNAPLATTKQELRPTVTAASTAPQLPITFDDTFDSASSSPNLVTTAATTATAINLDTPLASSPVSPTADSLLGLSEERKRRRHPHAALPPLCNSYGDEYDGDGDYYYLSVGSTRNQNNAGKLNRKRKHHSCPIECGEPACTCALLALLAPTLLLAPQQQSEARQHSVDVTTTTKNIAANGHQNEEDGQQGNDSPAAVPTVAIKFVPKDVMHERLYVKDAVPLLLPKEGEGDSSRSTMMNEGASTFGTRKSRSGMLLQQQQQAAEANKVSASVSEVPPNRENAKLHGEEEDKQQSLYYLREAKKAIRGRTEYAVAKSLMQLASEIDALSPSEPSPLSVAAAQVRDRRNTLPCFEHHLTQQQQQQGSSAANSGKGGADGRSTSLPPPIRAREPSLGGAAASSLANNGAAAGSLSLSPSLAAVASTTFLQYPRCLPLYYSFWHTQEHICYVMQHYAHGSLREALQLRTHNITAVEKAVAEERRRRGKEAARQLRIRIAEEEEVRRLHRVANDAFDENGAVSSDSILGRGTNQQLREKSASSPTTGGGDGGENNRLSAAMGRNNSDSPASSERNLSMSSSSASPSSQLRQLQNRNKRSVSEFNNSSQSGTTPRGGSPYDIAGRRSEEDAMSSDVPESLVQSFALKRYASFAASSSSPNSPNACATLTHRHDSAAASPTRGGRASSSIVGDGDGYGSGSGCEFSSDHSLRIPSPPSPSTDENVEGGRGSFPAQPPRPGAAKNSKHDEVDLSLSNDATTTPSPKRKSPLSPSKLNDTTAAKGSATAAKVAVEATTRDTRPPLSSLPPILPRIDNEDVLKHTAAQILTALQFLHHHGILYRDLKTENILVDAHGYVVLGDFDSCRAAALEPLWGNAAEKVPSTAIATANVANQPQQSSVSPSFHPCCYEEGRKIRSLDGTCAAPPPGTAEEQDVKGSAHKRTTSLVGTVDYLGPEVISDAPISTAVDSWGFGVLLFELATGVPPFRPPPSSTSSANNNNNAPDSSATESPHHKKLLAVLPVAKDKAVVRAIVDHANSNGFTIKDAELYRSAMRKQLKALLASSTGSASASAAMPATSESESKDFAEAPSLFSAASYASFTQQQLAQMASIAAATAAAARRENNNSNTNDAPAANSNTKTNAAEALIASKLPNDMADQSPSNSPKNGKDKDKETGFFRSLLNSIFGDKDDEANGKRKGAKGSDGFLADCDGKTMIDIRTTSLTPVRYDFINTCVLPLATNGARGGKGSGGSSPNSNLPSTLLTNVITRLLPKVPKYTFSQSSKRGLTRNPNCGDGKNADESNRGDEDLAVPMPLREEDATNFATSEDDLSFQRYESLVDDARTFGISPALLDLLQGLLHPHPNQRLTLEQCRKHRWWFYNNVAQQQQQQRDVNSPSSVGNGFSSPRIADSVFYNLYRYEEAPLLRYLQGKKPYCQHHQLALNDQDGGAGNTGTTLTRPLLSTAQEPMVEGQGGSGSTFSYAAPSPKRPLSSHQVTMRELLNAERIRPPIGNMLLDDDDDAYTAAALDSTLESSSVSLGEREGGGGGGGGADSEDLMKPNTLAHVFDVEMAPMVQHTAL